ncbi:MAG: hypothetical protein A3H17_00020 [Candidatus Levybacteria bacterium RIFCSPLOWO2_12_FULL_37_14]|nr:MAG: hypothetical protein US43_C0011G0004 [Candidatus Levybacteria bacterium GW2011_GWA1_37_16]KKQ42011.1 MAG: hypothetical protein US59_C0017G0004 [Candidatus Levybacteria bacterium GW2011_GWB1_37_8]OGH51261.1 MAG: hypothetical protein A3H17_00020 [Candidatus Levybacteria bacterium RIFCSPLOWO2_12_FULL_37_14]
MQHRHKKTRKEKIIADYRHQVYILKNKNISSNNSTLAISVSGNSYVNAHVLRDVFKAGALSFFIVAAQIILFVLLKNHIITLFMIKY